MPDSGRTLLGVCKELSHIKFASVDLLAFLFSKPANTFAPLPQAVLATLLLSVIVCAHAVLFALVPPPVVFTPICPVINSEAFLFIGEVLAVVTHTVGVDIDSIPLHIVVAPGAVVLAAISPQVYSVPVNLVVEPLAVVGGAILPRVLTVAFLLTEYVAALVLGAFGPRLSALTILLIILPPALVSSTFHILINSLSICFVIMPLTLIDVAIDMVEFSETLGVIEVPLSLVSRIVRPSHDTLAVTHASLPLSIVHSARSILVTLFPDWRILVELSLQCFEAFLSLEILHTDMVVDFEHTVAPSFKETSHK